MYLLLRVSNKHGLDTFAVQSDCFSRHCINSAHIEGVISCADGGSWVEHVLLSLSSHFAALLPFLSLRRRALVQYPPWLHVHRAQLAGD